MKLSDYEVVIGLEVHCQLKTATKLFTACPYTFGGEPNSHTDPVSWALPGVLPVPNQQAVAHAVRLGLAVGAQINLTSRWARKHYFYPDSPFGYQVTQNDQPYCSGGLMQVPAGPDHEAVTVRLHHIHMEADAGKNIHVPGESVSLVDLNRAGAPLVEIVSEPDLRSAAQAAAYMRELRTLVRTLGISDANMEEGTLRCDANVSLRKRGEEAYGTRCEIKNLNSFRFVEMAIGAEIRRQFDLFCEGKRVIQSTLAYDTDKDRTWVMRTKEDAADYLYFPEPDMPPLVLEEAWVASLAADLPELPAAKRNRYLGLGLNDEEVRILTEDADLSVYFEAVLACDAPAKKAASWLLVELVGRLNREQQLLADSQVTPTKLAQIVALLEDGTVSGPGAKKLFDVVYATGDEPSAVVEREGLRQVSDLGAIEAAVREVMAQNPKQVEGLLAGNVKLRGFFVGQSIKKCGGQGNPALINQVLDRLLAASSTDA